MEADVLPDEIVCAILNGSTACKPWVPLKWRPMLALVCRQWHLIVRGTMLHHVCPRCGVGHDRNIPLYERVTITNPHGYDPGRHRALLTGTVLCASVLIACAPRMDADLLLSWVSSARSVSDIDALIVLACSGLTTSAHRAHFMALFDVPSKTASTNVRPTMIEDSRLVREDPNAMGCFRACARIERSHPLAANREHTCHNPSVCAVMHAVARSGPPRMLGVLVERLSLACVTSALYQAACCDREGSVAYLLAINGWSTPHMATIVADTLWAAVGSNGALRVMHMFNRIITGAPTMDTRMRRALAGSRNDALLEQALAHDRALVLKECITQGLCKRTIQDHAKLVGHLIDHAASECCETMLALMPDTEHPPFVAMLNERFVKHVEEFMPNTSVLLLEMAIYGTWFAPTSVDVLDTLFYVLTYSFPLLPGERSEDAPVDALHSARLTIDLVVHLLHRFPVLAIDAMYARDSFDVFLMGCAMELDWDSAHRLLREIAQCLEVCAKGNSTPAMAEKATAHLRDMNLWTLWRAQPLTAMPTFQQRRHARHRQCNHAHNACWLAGLARRCSPYGNACDSDDGQWRRPLWERFCTPTAIDEDALTCLACDAVAEKEGLADAPKQARAYLASRGLLVPAPVAATDSVL